ncbi:hypothetical protein BDW02DRAFT_582684 [Decorospora gaudefroyi]|uniref:Uncharacterized protein n=1 Tax=Decorospora gaudefroyi TaxID=184978 RepID=A0A6A5K730_9PLEO|nr:hypothetical protein BDW02DRAFT_582684 [Decorospora gaudefroyi]
MHCFSEIRNEVYYYGLDMNETRAFSWQSAKKLKSKHRARRVSNKVYESTANLMLTCKRVYLEAISLLEQTATVLLHLSDILRPPAAPNIPGALSSFADLSIRDERSMVSRGKKKLEHGWELLDVLNTLPATYPQVGGPAEAAAERRRREAVVILTDNILAGVSHPISPISTILMPPRTCVRALGVVSRLSWSFVSQTPP